MVAVVRVLAVTPLYPPEHRVGSWLSTHECLRALAARGHTVKVVSSLASGNDYTIDRVRVTTGTERLGDHIRRAQLVITHFGDMTEADATARRLGKPLVKMVHGGVSPNGWRPLHVDPPTLTVWNSHSLQVEAGYTGPSVVVHPPLDPEDFRVTPGNRFTLINLSEAKGVGTFTRVARMLPHTMFLGVQGGYGAQRKVGGSNVRTMPMTADMKNRVYALTRVLMCPSALETWGRVGIEAMVSGIPVIAHPTPGLVESLGDAGIFVDRRDTKGWIAQVQRLSDDDEWAKASEKALKRVAELDPASWGDRFADAVEAIL